MPAPPDTDALLAAAVAGDPLARSRLLDRHRRRLRKMIAARIDRRVAARVDPSDLVQETLAAADHRLDQYLADRPLPFYPWLRQLALDRIGMAHRRHLRAGRRAVGREEPGGLDPSADGLAERLADSVPEPGSVYSRAERRARVREAVERLPERDREVLVLRHLEGLSTAEAATALGLSEGAVKMRLLRAVQRLHDLLTEDRP